MKALLASSYGPVDQLTVTDVTKPAPEAGQVLIKVRAASLNALDIRLTTGEFREQMPVEHPFHLGLDAAGTVEAVGEGVSRFKAGDEVVAFTYPFFGTVAEYALATEGPNLVHRPQSLSPETAAALPQAAMTAAAAHDAAQLKSGQSALVIGASGGVGSYLVQLAHRSGAQVLATGKPEDDEYLRRLGAVETIDYTGKDVVEEARRLRPDGVDVVIDLVNAGPGLAATAAAAKPDGLLVSTLGGAPGFERGVTAAYVGVEQGIGQLEDLVRRAAERQLDTHVDALPFSRAVEAAQRFAGSHSRGKLVITF
ncbi:NADP-dependent oxidoreductase [Streptomyces albireticuli]|uniref:NADP-dependent oxidoreductase n=1 Tax=Streptomyces albireticuli TaxID=1940 RepID=UPI001E5400E1|nr:NADP-dependent oxidoreductase [Streptomyces albireticuli]MCD9141278.1 NADP-dependent oxidoreductase [Streptomyces albireticuli]